MESPTASPRRTAKAVSSRMSATLDKLESTSWDFAGESTSNGPHRIHPYPAKFIPQIPRTLIDLFHPQDGSAILDPFCGSGTAMVAAQGVGCPSVGIDLSPLATLIAKVKTTPIFGDIASSGRETTFRARQRLARGKVSVPPIPRVDHWFKPNVQLALAAILSELQRLKDADLVDALRVALSSIIVRVSNQDSDTRYAAIEKNVTSESVFQGFERAANSLAASLEGHFQRSVGQPAPVKIITKDLMRVTPAEIGCDVGLVVTSPPYPNAYEYWLYHKYRMYWLGMDPIAVRESEIGARPHYFKKNHQTEVDFERQMGVCFKLLSQVMRPKAYACFVVGRSIIHGREINNEDLLERAAGPHGFCKLASVQRNIAINRKSFNLSHGTINREGILIFARNGK